MPCAPVTLQMMKLRDIFFKRPARVALPLLPVAFAGIFAAGCGGRHSQGLSVEVIAPKPPGFLTGPASTLLTNGAAFSARVTVEAPAGSNQVQTISGQLLGEGSRLVFEPARGDRTYIWDVDEHSGYVLSEALQGYAPFASPVQVTNMATVAEVAGPASDRVNGHPGHEVEVNIAMDDGTSARFSIWRASDLYGYPVRIKSLSATKPFIVNLSDIKQTTLTSNLFLPPDGFTKYNSPDSMAGELMVRKSKPKHTDSDYFGEVQPVLRNTPP